MTRVEKLKLQVEELSAEELATFREWFAEFDGERWDRQIETDAAAGKLDALAERALRDHAAGPLSRTVKHHAAPDFWAA